MTDLPQISIHEESHTSLNLKIHSELLSVVIEHFLYNLIHEKYTTPNTYLFLSWRNLAWHTLASHTFALTLCCRRTTHQTHITCKCQEQIISRLCIFLYQFWMVIVCTQLNTVRLHLRGVCSIILLHSNGLLRVWHKAEYSQETPEYCQYWGNLTKLQRNINTYSILTNTYTDLLERTLQTLFYFLDLSGLSKGLKAIPKFRQMSKPWSTQKKYTNDFITTCFGLSDALKAIPMCLSDLTASD